MFERYTERARRVIFFARYEASAYGSKAIETEHILLGLLREDKDLLDRFFPGGAAQVIRQKIDALVTRGLKVSTSIDLRLSDEGKRILAFANEEAETLTHRDIGTEHLLLGILRESGCLAARVLGEIGIEIDAVRAALSKSNEGMEAIPEQGLPTVAPNLNAMWDSISEEARTRTSSTHLEEGTTVVETRQFYNGHLILIVERFRMGDDGKTLIYSQEVVGPKPGQRHKHAVEFDVS